MKYNKILKENEYNKNSFLITCVCSILLLLTLCYFGINSVSKGTLAADVCSGGTAINGYCCPAGYTSGVTSSGLCYNSEYNSSTNKCKRTVASALKDQYLSVGWSCTGTPGTGSGSVYATWDCTTSVIAECTKQGTSTTSCYLNFEGKGTVSGTLTTTSSGTYCSVTAPSAPTKSGYVFVGWGTAGEVKPGEKILKSAGTTVSAYWKANKCYQCNGDDTKFYWGVSPSSSICPSGWHERTDYTNQSDCESQKFTVTYNANGGSVSPTTQIVVDGKQITLLTPTKSGYTFAGWYIGTTSGSKAGNAGDKYTVSGNVTLVAKWEVNTYNVTYNANDGSVKCGSATTGAATCIENVNYGSSPSLPKPTRNNYDFVAWHVGTVSGTKVGTDYKVTENITLVAEWKAKSSGGSTSTEKEFIANFNPNGGSLTTSGSTLKCSGVSSCTISKGIPSASKECYVFKGWGTSQSCTSGDFSSVTLTKTPTTFYACWVKDSSCDNNPEPGTGNDPDPTPGTNPDPGKEPEPTPEPDENVPDNPPTGGVTTIAIIWFCGLLAIGYAFYYFKSIREN